MTLLLLAIEDYSGDVRREKRGEFSNSLFLLYLTVRIAREIDAFEREKVGVLTRRL